MIHAETVGANGMPPTIMVFQVSLNGEHLNALLESAERMPPGQRSVPGHLKDILTILLTPEALESRESRNTDTAGVPQSDAGTNGASSTSDTAAPTPSVRKSSKRRTLKDIAVEDDMDAVLT
jgi:hypothetical protein